MVPCGRHPPCTRCSSRNDGPNGSDQRDCEPDSDDSSCRWWQEPDQLLRALLPLQVLPELQLLQELLVEPQLRVALHRRGTGLVEGTLGTVASILRGRDSQDRHQFPGSNQVLLHPLAAGEELPPDTEQELLQQQDSQEEKQHLKRGHFINIIISYIFQNVDLLFTNLLNFV